MSLDALSRIPMLPRSRKGLEVNTLVMLIIVVVFVLVALIAIIFIWGEGNVFAGENNICQLTGGFFGGCS